MNKKTKLLLGIVAFAALIVLAVFAYNGLRNTTDAPDLIHEEEADDRIRAVDFIMLDQDDNEVQLSDFFGKPIVLNFWTTWCPSCVIESPYFELIYQEMGDEVHIIKVNLLDGQRETRSRVDTFMADNSYTFPLYFDTTGEAAGAYGVRTIPFSVFIDADGYVVGMAQGALDEAGLRRGIDLARDGA